MRSLCQVIGLMFYISKNIFLMFILSLKTNKSLIVCLLCASVQVSSGAIRLRGRTCSTMWKRTVRSSGTTGPRSSCLWSRATSWGSSTASGPTSPPLPWQRPPTSAWVRPPQLDTDGCVAIIDSQVINKCWFFLDNLVEGKRRRRGGPAGENTPNRGSSSSPRTPGTSSKRKLMSSEDDRTPAKRGRRGARAGTERRSPKPWLHLNRPGGGGGWFISGF